MVEYKKNEQGETVKITTRTRVVKIEKKQYEVEKERKKWRRFGGALKEQEGESVTARALEDVPFERVAQQKQTQEEKKAANIQQALQGSDKQAIVGSLKDMLYQRRMARQLAAARGQIAAPEKPPEDDDVPGALPTAGKSGGFVPSILRNRPAGAAAVGDSMDMKRREENSVRVTNLSEDTREDDLRELFSPFGPISRIYIAYDRETGENRGFAFVNFVYREHADKAIQKLDGWGYDNLILRVEWAQPRAERP